MADQTAAILSPFLRRQRIKQGVLHARGKVLDFGCGVGKLCEQFAPEDYTGVDRDEEVIQIARKNYPSHTFYSAGEFTAHHDLFDTIIALAVIEHISDPRTFLIGLKKQLKPNGRIVLTTPNPIFGWVHHLGSKVGLFSAEADEEHEDLINHDKMGEIAAAAGFKLSLNKKFLFRANQLFVLENTDQ